MPSENNKRIAKNTMLLYVRMIIIMFVSLFTSRIILKNLGVEDYGIYNVVGGVVNMFSFISASMSTSTLRFLSFELGKNDLIEFNRKFNTSLEAHIIIAIITILLSESIGLWFLNKYLVIPDSRMVAANWVYQAAILMFVINIIQVPFNSSIIAHEKMGIYAYISIAEVSFKLLIAYLISIVSSDKLKFYALMLVIVQIVIASFYFLYSLIKHKECKLHFIFEKQIFNEVFSFAGWNLFGSIAWVANGQGVNILLNLFFGPVVNAARGISMQVKSALSGFVTNFQTAFKPQITKYYAAGQIKELHNLIYKGSKYSFFLMLFFSIPFIIESHEILTIWLDKFPKYADTFTTLIMVEALINTLSDPLIISLMATGNIKKYQIVVSSILLLNLPVSYIFLKMGYSPVIVYIVSIFITISAIFGRLVFVKKQINIPIREYYKEVMKPITICTLLSLIIPVIVSLMLKETILRLIIVAFLSTIISSITIYFIGLKKNEKKFLIDFVRSKIQHQR